VELVVDADRLKYDDLTKIYVRAKDPDGKYGTFDIATLTKASLKEWLLSRNDALWQANVVAVILGHGQFDK
jgi:hypothetical protein